MAIGEEGTSKIKFWSYVNNTNSFSMYTDLGDQIGTTSLTAIDHDGDSKLDVVRTSTRYHNLTVFNTPTIGLYSYSNAISFPTPYFPMVVDASDMNNDMMTDLIVIARSSAGNGTVTIYYRDTITVSNANDNQIIKDISPGPSTIGDFNGDGKNELAVYDPINHKVRFVREGYPNLAERIAPASISAIVSEDLNFDGFDDLMLVVSDTASVQVWFGGSTFLFGGGSSVTITSTLGMAYSLTTGDLNNDSKTDLAVGGLGGVNIFWGSGSGTLYSNSNRFSLLLIGANVTSLTCGQLDKHRDDLLDLALVNASSSSIEIYYQQTTGATFKHTNQTEFQSLNPPLMVGNISSSDMNSDGRDDLITSSTSAIYLFLQSSSYTNGFSESQTIETKVVLEGVGSFNLGDLDDDGDMELAVATRNSTIMAYEFEYPNFVLMTRQTVGASPVMLLVNDMNDDLKDDLIAYSTLSRTISFFYQNNFAPTAFWTVQAGVHLEGVAITFNGSSSFDSVSDQALLTYNWNFGNGHSGSGGLDPYYTYAFPDNGTFTVTLTVTDQSGLNDTYWALITIVDLGPTAALSYSGTMLMEGQPVQFNDLSTSDPDLITSWHWAFGDGHTSSEQNPQNTYAGNGIYVVELTVTDEDGSVDSATINVTVNDSAPTSIFQIDTASPMEKQVVTFSDHSTYIVDPIVSWYWTFGDGGNSTLKDPTHAYQNNGTYLITLYVTDSDGSPRSSNQTLTVSDSSPSLTGLFTSDGKSAYNEWDEVRFVVNATVTQDGIVRYQWDFQTNGFQVDQETTFNTVTHR
ncbi:MAG: PKD domain-containing protein, partial [Methanomassiliicoccales archaeon]|nr:PKD domain-containing protein [Methanomassiliicoccales archaeon]